MKRIRRVARALTPVLAICCGDSDGVGGVAPSLTAPARPALTVSFEADAISVTEGETVGIGVRYQVNELASPLSLTISPLDDGTAPEDYELSALSFEIPAGRNASGTAAVSLTALVDERITEGNETMQLRLVPPQEVRARLDQNLEVTITEAGGAPCAGVRVLGTPPAEETPTRWRIRTTTLAISMAGDADDRILLDWEGPYWKIPGESWDMLTPILDATAAEWEVQALPEVIRHTVRIEWPLPKTLRLRFRATDGTCDQDQLQCNADGCMLTGAS